MNALPYRWILYTIAFVILATIGIQVYWNYKNYLSSKQQLVNDVQVSLDKAVDDYYANLAERSTIAFAFKSPDSLSFLNENKPKRFQHLITEHRGFDSVDIELIENLSIEDDVWADSISKFSYGKQKAGQINKAVIDVIRRRDTDSLGSERFRTLTSKVLISLTNDSLSLKGIDSLLKLELKRKKIGIDYSLNYVELNDSIRAQHQINVVNWTKVPKPNRHLLRTNSESTFLPHGSTLTINFTNVTQIILQRIMGGILISLLLVLAVISSLFYLLNIIKQQKQLAEVKNDLISNITHEFKTPIATIGVAIESIKDFDMLKDQAKTKKYLELSSGQLTKLNLMVEKLLETATLDSDHLELEKENHNISEVLQNLVDKLQIQSETKSMNFLSPEPGILARVDLFHFENAIGNILDNALKYGGNVIKVALRQDALGLTVSVTDNGNTIAKAHKNKIFEKFYRIPKGNTHDVKGFGIGLYYTKKIVEKHGGRIELDLKKNSTTFHLYFPNA